MAIPFPAFDADNHYYEATDAFTPKHLKSCASAAAPLVSGRRNGMKNSRQMTGPTL